MSLHNIEYYFKVSKSCLRYNALFCAKLQHSLFSTSFNNPFDKNGIKPPLLNDKGLTYNYNLKSNLKDSPNIFSSRKHFSTFKSRNELQTEESNNSNQTEGINKANNEQENLTQHNFYHLDIPTQTKKIKNFTVRNDHVVIFTDGACENNGKREAKAGFGVWFGVNHQLNVSKPVQGRPTNNTAEIQACITALEIARKENIGKIEIMTDSHFVIKSMTEWIENWKKNRWKTSTGKAVKNKDDFIKLDALVSEFKNIKWSYVPGHKGVQGNEGADQLAKNGALLYKA